MIRIRQIDHIVLRTDQPERLEAFYCEVLGCVRERALAPEIGLVQLRAGSALIDLVDVNSALGKPGGAAPGSSGRNLDHLCLEIDAITESDLRSWLEQHGAVAGPAERRYGATGFALSVYVQDPDGNTVELRPIAP